MSLEHTTALVTGGASGMGEATAHRLAAEGAHVVIVDRDAGKGETVAKELDGTFARADVTNEEEVRAAVATATAVAPLRSAIHCAGVGWAERTINRDGSPHNLETFRKIVEINLIGTFNVLRLCASGMNANDPDANGERGVIVNTASVAAYDGQIGQAAYSASKGGVVALTLTAARDLSAAGIRVCTIAPGLIDTPLLGGLPDDARAQLAQSVLFPKRLGAPDDFASLALEIVRNHYLNGEVIRMDAGIRMPPEVTSPTIDLLDGGFYADDPSPTYAWMREHAPVYYDAKHDVWGLASYAAVLAASKDPKTFSSAGGIRPDTGPLPMMIDMDDPAHWTRRKLVNRGFTPGRVRDSEQKIREVADSIIDRVCERGTCDFVKDIAAPLPMIMIGDMLGVAPEDRDDLLRWSDDMVSAQSGSASEAQYMQAMNAMTEYTAFCQHAVAERQATPTDDLMSVLVHAEVDGDRLDPDEVLHESLLILVGGDETTRHVISGGMEQLLLHPEQRKLLQEDAGKIPVAVEEMLRWVSPIKNMCRTVTHDVEFMGQQLRAGQKCMLLYESANRDAAKFPDPEHFDVERQPNEHVAFGFGAHYCLGQALARLELKVMLEQLLVRLPDLEFAADPTTLPRRRANFISGLESMPVRFTRTRALDAGV